ncbi:hypothetical protein MA16_Dca026567 [Dendrobium catenatum]|uniref:Retrotransposon Copia-like N-terminal domain-containing protein n=1 Tax=Dendrobium catenatum TaxID=906689 RepID=A0A2I0VE12_9ASPA|nr:hypothetical protein MA16_Dca026567 [Dendrobium catenatum]
MGDSTPISAASTPQPTQHESSSSTDIHIPPTLKFLLSNIKNVINVQLLPDNYPTWRSAIQKLYAANSFSGYLDETQPCPSKHLLTAVGQLILNPHFFLVVDRSKSIRFLVLHNIYIYSSLRVEPRHHSIHLEDARAAFLLHESV